MKDIKKVAVLYSGGKDSNYAVEYCLERGWEIAYLLSVKPNRKDCYLFHYATVEHTALQAKALGLKHILVDCNVADPVKEAEIVKNVVEGNMVDAVVLGGTGLQVTQIQSVQRALLPLGVEAFPSHGGYEHDDLLKDMVERGYRFMITQIASDGMGKWLGKIITKGNIDEFFKDSKRYGFPAGGDGGYYDSFLLDAPFLKAEIIPKIKVCKQSDMIGHVEFGKVEVKAKLGLVNHETS